jgi:hypothetical protein
LFHDLTGKVRIADLPKSLHDASWFALLAINMMLVDKELNLTFPVISAQGAIAYYTLSPKPYSLVIHYH